MNERFHVGHWKLQLNRQLASHKKLKPEKFQLFSSLPLYACCRLLSSILCKTAALDSYARIVLMIASNIFVFVSDRAGNWSLFICVFWS